MVNFVSCFIQNFHAICTYIFGLISDMYADAVLCAVLQAESMDTPSYVPTSASSMKVDKMHFKVIQVNNYEVVLNFFHIRHNLTWYSTIVHKFARIYPVCSIHVNLCKKIAQLIPKKITCTNFRTLEVKVRLESFKSSNSLSSQFFFYHQ